MHLKLNDDCSFALNLGLNLYFLFSGCAMRANATTKVNSGWVLCLVEVSGSKRILTRRSAAQNSPRPASSSFVQLSDIVGSWRPGKLNNISNLRDACSWQIGICGPRIRPRYCISDSRHIYNAEEKRKPFEEFIHDWKKRVNLFVYRCHKCRSSLTVLTVSDMIYFASLSTWYMYMFDNVQS